MRKVTFLGTLILLLLLGPAVVYADGDWEADGFGGYLDAGSNFGSGWEADGFGGYRGTGDNFGRSMTPDGLGGWNIR